MLIVIDVQPEFKAAKPIIPAVLDAIKIAKRNSELIILLEYEGYSESYAELRRLLRGYPYFLTAKKKIDDGCRSALDAAGAAGYSVERCRWIKVCGVNTTYCIKSTVKSLSKELPNKQITILSKACNCCYANKFKWVDKLRNVTVI
jgi:nicotinamidase-related amidase